MWKVFYDDKDRPNRYLLAKEFIRRPDAEEIEVSCNQQVSEFLIRFVKDKIASNLVL